MYVGNDCLIESHRFWYNCTDGAVLKTNEYPGTKATDPDNISYWVYTHFGLNILWIVTILLLLVPTSSKEKGINIFKQIISPSSVKFVFIVLIDYLLLYFISL